MGIKIQRLPDGSIQVTVRDTILPKRLQDIIRPALTRHITEMSAAIEAATKPVMAKQRAQSILNRRHAFRLIEQFDMVPLEVNPVERWLGVIYTELDQSDIELLRGAVLWFRMHWAEKGEQYNAAFDLSELLGSR